MLMECLYAAAQQYSIHPYLIQAIAWVESRGNPWALSFKTAEEIDLKNVRVKVEKRGNYFLYSVFPSSKEEALRVLASVKEPISVDYGLMQINDFWLKKFGLTPAQVLEPCTNLYLGAYIIAYCRAKKGEWWSAVECYHRSETVNSPGHYAAEVCKILYGGEACQF